MKTLTLVLKTLPIVCLLPLVACTPGFMLSPEGHAERIYAEMSQIEQAVRKYERKYGYTPEVQANKAEDLLRNEGFIKSFPVPHPSVFGPNKKKLNYQYDPTYDKMDNGNKADAAIALWGLRDDICMSFNALYSSDQSGPRIFDSEANGNKYPGAVLGTHMKLYAIKWKSDAIDDCEVNWVIQYNH